ncbi:MAG: TauD/TfdA dioxygenase family protein, partial [bacterium]
MMAATAGPRAVISGRFGKLEVVPFDGAMGAEIRGLDLRALDEESFRVLYQAYLDHVLVLVRGQELSDVQQVEVSRRFGPLETPPTASERSSHQHVDGPPEITVVSNRKVGGVPIGELGDG